MPHHITKRGNRRQATFFCDDDYTAYLDLMAEWRHEHSVVSEEELRDFRPHERTVHPLGDEDFVRRLERKLGRVLQ